MKNNSIKNYFQNLKEKEVINATSKELQETYSFIDGIGKVKGNYYSKISKIVDLMILYAKNNNLINEEEYKSCINLKNESYAGLKGTLGDISMIINEKEFMQAENLNPNDKAHMKILLDSVSESGGPILIFGDPELDLKNGDLETLVKDQK
jgi:hypothetical protein